MMPSNRFPEVTTSAPTPLLAISSTASYTVWAGYGRMGIARVACPSLQRRPGCKIDPPLPRDIGPFCMHMERDFPFALLLPGISESAYHRVDNFHKVIIFHPNSVFVSPAWNRICSSWVRDS